MISASSARRRRSSSHSGKYEPSRSFGSCTSMVPARVSKIPVSVTVAAIDPLESLAVVGATDRIRLRAHQRLDEPLQHRAQQIRAGLREVLVQPAGRVDTWLSGHRGVSSSRVPSTDLVEDHAVAVSRHDATLTKLYAVHHVNGRFFIDCWLAKDHRQWGRHRLRKPLIVAVDTGPSSAELRSRRSAPHRRQAEVGAHGHHRIQQPVTRCWAMLSSSAPATNSRMTSDAVTVEGGRAGNSSSAVPAVRWRPAAITGWHSGGLAVSGPKLSGANGTQNHGVDVEHQTTDLAVG